MATTQNRTTDDVRRDIEYEREQLVLAVDQLRSEATSFKRKLPKIAAGIVATIVAYKLTRVALRRIYG
jgi:hypothetical protein